MDQRELDALVKSLRQIGTDTSSVEVKAAARGFPKKLVRDISSFANTDGGTVILGLDEENGFASSPHFDARSIADALATVCREQLVPSVTPQIDILTCEDAPVVVGTIAPLDPRLRPCYVAAQGKYCGSFIRAHDGARKLKPYEIDRLEENRTQPLWESEIVPRAGLVDLDPEIIQGILQRERLIHERIFKSKSDEDALLSLNVLARDDRGVPRPTIAGLLCAGAFPQQFFPRLSVTFSNYVGDSKAANDTGQRFIDNQSFVGPIPLLVFDAVTAVQRNMRVGGMIEGVYRKDLPDYPPIAVREAITNALMHRDYSPQARGAQVQVNMYPDRLEIFNPGGLYGIVTEDNLGQAGISSTRNQYLSRILEVCEYPAGGFVAENRGSGYQEILSQLEAQMLPPPIPEDSLTGFRLTFKIRQPTAPEKQAANAQSSRQRIIDYASKHATSSSRELAAAAGITLSGARRILKDLVEEGELERTRPLRSPKQRYRLVR